MDSLPQALPKELRRLVKWSVALLGGVIERELGARLYEEIEGLRKQMAGLRELPRAPIVRSTDRAYAVLETARARLAKRSPADRLAIAHAFTLMLEVMNVAENAYRSYRLRDEAGPAAAPEGPSPEAIIYVLTAHPTEARSPANIAAFHEVQKLLIRALAASTAAGAKAGTEAETDSDAFEPRYPAALEAELRHALEVAWRVSTVRERKPSVRDEAEHIYSTVLRDETLSTLLDVGAERVPVYIRSWVGGDKDGHPGVDERALRDSLSLSRRLLLRYVRERLARTRATTDLFGAPELRRDLTAIERKLSRLTDLRAGDARQVAALRAAIAAAAKRYEERVGALHPDLRRLRQLLRAFPGLVVPLELRESSDILTSGAPFGKLAIDRMLKALAAFARGGDPRWYARGFIISMADSLEHVQAAAARSRRAFGRERLPIIPLFEQKAALDRSADVARAMARDPGISRAIRENWGGYLEVMVGYSDSSKENGVLPSRVAIALAMERLERECERDGVRPLFFQGSGGSVDRGGGSIADQTAWWPRSALSIYKVTVQGEMVERSLASPEIARGQLERIAESTSRTLRARAGAGRAPVKHSPALSAFADRVGDAYRARVGARDFMGVVEKVTPYPWLNLLRIGSRPSKRAAAGTLELTGLRAIPWILCWTQTRVLFPTWWGIGSAWRETPAADRKALARAFGNEPVFASFIKALGFTLAKVELPVWRMYLARSELPSAEADALFAEFVDEYRGAREFLRAITGEDEPLWFRPWLGASIRLRSSMIHPLNLLQLIAREENDTRLFRQTVTGIASGMLTTG